MTLYNVLAPLHKGNCETLTTPGQSPEEFFRLKLIGITLYIPLFGDRIIPGEPSDLAVPVEDDPCVSRKIIISYCHGSKFYSK